MTGVTLIQIPQWGTVTLLELIWAVIGGVTVLFVLFMLRIVALGWLSTPKGTIERRAARAYVRRELVRLFQGSCILVVGIYVSIQKGVTPGPAFVTPSGVFIVASLFAIAASVIFQSFFDWIDRRNIIRAIQKEGVNLYE